MKPEKLGNLTPLGGALDGSGTTHRRPSGRRGGRVPFDRRKAKYTDKTIRICTYTFPQAANIRQEDYLREPTE